MNVFAAAKVENSITSLKPKSNGASISEHAAPLTAQTVNSRGVGWGLPRAAQAAAAALIAASKKPATIAGPAARCCRIWLMSFAAAAQTATAAVRMNKWRNEN